jgi:hypothetical protein
MSPNTFPPHLTALGYSPTEAPERPISERPPALRHYPGLRLRKEPPAPAVPAPVVGRFFLYFAPGGHLAVTNRYVRLAERLESAEGFSAAAKAWKVAAWYRNPLPDSEPENPQPRPYNTSRERARRGRQAAAWAAGEERRWYRAAHRRLDALERQFHREQAGRELAYRLGFGSLVAVQLGRLIEFNRLIREHNARHSPYEGLL